MPRALRLFAISSARALSTTWKPPANRVAELFPATDDARRRAADSDAVFVVTGATGGIGAKVVAKLVERTRGTVYACARDPSRVEASDRVVPVALDLRDDASPARRGIPHCLLAARRESDEMRADDLRRVFEGRDVRRAKRGLAALPEAVGGRVDVLFNAVGLLHRGDASPERSLDRVDRAWLLESFDVNCAGPLLATKALRKALDAGRRGSDERPPSVVASLSARVGSISDNGLGGWRGAVRCLLDARREAQAIRSKSTAVEEYSHRYSYRASKAALNMATVNCAIELKRQRTICVALHPGTTDTGLSKPFQKRVVPEKLFPADFVAEQLLDIVDGLTEDHSGGFYDWAGEAVEY